MTAARSDEIGSVRRCTMSCPVSIAAALIDNAKPPFYELVKVYDARNTQGGRVPAMYAIPDQ